MTEPAPGPLTTTRTGIAIHDAGVAVRNIVLTPARIITLGLLILLVGASRSQASEIAFPEGSAALWRSGSASYVTQLDAWSVDNTFVADALPREETILLAGNDATKVFVPATTGESEPRPDNPFIESGSPVPPVIVEPPIGNMDAIRLTTPGRGWQFLPPDTLFRSLIAGVHAPRMAAEVVGDNKQGTLLDVAIGSRISMIRFGTVDPDGPSGSEGVELQVYGASFTRLAMDREMDVEAIDYKFGVPIAWKFGSTSHQIGYDHLSSHIGDEYLERHPNFKRRNYVRDAIRYTIMQDITEDLAVYADVNYAFHRTGGAGRWHFQFGAEYEPYVPHGYRGAPVAAINTEMRQEFDFEGSLGLIVGWQWRGYENDNLLRLGLSVYSGHSRQYSYFDKYESLVGVGLWYDF